MREHLLKKTKNIVLKRFFFLNSFLLTMLALLMSQFIKTANTTVPPMDMYAPGEKVAYAHNNLLPRKKIKPRDHYSIIPELNLFSPYRAPHDENVDDEDTSDHSPVNEDYLLHGTIIIGEEKVAFIEERKTREVERYYLGDRIGEYVISDIRWDRALLTGNPNETPEVIKMFQERKHRDSRKNRKARIKRSSSSRRRSTARPQQSLKKYDPRRAREKSRRANVRRSPSR